MKLGKCEDFDDVWSVFQQNKQWFPHVRSSHIKNRLNLDLPSKGSVIWQDGVVITYQVYKKKRKISANSDIVLNAGDCVIHQIVARDKGNGSAFKVMKEFLFSTDKNVYLTVRSDNIAANKFYEKLGMQIVGETHWGKEKIKGKIWNYNHSRKLV